MEPVLSIDPREGTVTGPAGKVRLEPKVMEVLIVLARYSGHVVSRDELMQAVWPDVVVTDHTLSRCIYQLREQLRAVVEAGDIDDDDPIETLPKRGYRLLLNVERSAPDLKVAGDSLLIELKRPRVLAVGLVLFALAVVGYLLLLS